MKSSKQLVLSALFLALGLLLPFLTGQIPSLGNKLLPMHIPILLCGFICGKRYGLIVGFITPLLRSFLLTTPPPFIAVTMAFELATYGFVAGLIYNLLPKNKIYIYVSLIISMLVGRIVWGIASAIVFGSIGMEFNWELFVAGGFINAIPGIIIQIILIPILVMAINRERMVKNA
ncbi:MAG: ECF transporter S component [Clostridiales bacterium]|nr:ECF transporter S component [Clostridiales bacterium]